jgi:hypothetical protein
MRDAYELYLNTVVKPFQDAILKGLRPVFSACNVTLPLDFDMLIPASFLDPRQKEANARAFAEKKKSEYPRVREIYG